MSRKKKHEHVNHERWLVSYADFITLLFAFFVVLFASSQGDKRKQIKLASAIQAAFNTYGIFEPRAAKMPLAQGTTLVAPAASTMEEENSLELFKKSVTAGGNVARESGRNLQAALEAAGLSRAVTVRQTTDGMVLSLHEAAFFDSGSAELKPGAMTLLLKLGDVIGMAAIRVEGHTDNMPIHNERFRSNWELSTERANCVAEELVEHSLVSPSRLSIAGYGEYHPVASNRTEEGRMQNRRVDIVLLRGQALGSGEQTAATVSPHPESLR